MKKLIVALVAVIFGVVNVNAMTTDQLMAKLSETYTIGKESFTLDKSVLTQIEQYLSSTATDAEKDVIAKQVDNVYGYFQKNPEQFTADELSDEAKDVILAAKEALETQANLIVELTEDGIVATNARTGEPAIKVEENGVTVRETGSNYVLVAIASVISLAGLAVVTKKIAD